jgi:hypothetical protein
VRRTEIAGGVLGLAAAVVSWSGEWWSWLIVGGSLVSLSPWPGAAAILRRAEKRPEILIADPERRRERSRRLMRYVLPLNALVFTAVGYLVFGVGGAIFFLALAAVSGGLSYWLLSTMRL